MRNTKIVSALVALVLSFSIVGFVGSPAQAAKPAHDLSQVQGGKTPKGQLFIGGKIPTAPNKNITIQRKLKGQAAYKGYKKVKLTAKGKFKVNVDGPIGSCFKIIVPKTSEYKTTKAKVGCIVAV